MADRRHPAPLAETPRGSRTATFIALGVSGLLHGALAGTVLTWDSDPIPLPASPVITVELVSVAPETGAPAPPGGSEPSAGRPESETPVERQPVEPPATETGGATMSVAEAAPVEPREVPTEPEPLSDAVPAEVTMREEIPEIAVNEPSPMPEFAPPRRRPERVPPAVLAAVEPPVRPQEARRQEPENRPLETTFEQPVAEIAAESIPADRDELADISDGSQGLDWADEEVPLETAGVPEAGSGGEGSGETEDPLGGLFAGPSFHLGSARNPLPRYPAIARRRGWEGRVVLRVEVDSDGRPLSVAIAQSSDHSVLDDAARSTIRRWLFEPGRRGGQAVVAVVEVPVVFRLHD